MPPRKPGIAATEPTAAVPLSTDFCADDADVVIRAAGTLDFRAHKFILSFASPFFKVMFTVPQPPSDSPGTLPHVDVQESSKTWENLLRTIYPMSNPTIENLDDLESLLLAAKKYEMQGVIDSHNKSLEHRAFIKQDPLRLYAIACACGSGDQAKWVAKNADILTVVRSPRNGVAYALDSASYLRLFTFLVERDNAFHRIVEEGWATFKCECMKRHDNLYKTAIAELRTPHTQMEEVYLKALADRSLFEGGCGRSYCAMKTPKIENFLERMFKERERVCSRFMWER